jgi:hypothetical protein
MTVLSPGNQINYKRRVNAYLILRMCAPIEINAGALDSHHTFIYPLQTDVIDFVI